MKNVILNLFLFATQWLFIKWGGKVYVERKKIILVPPERKSWHVTDARVEAVLLERDKIRSAQLPLEPSKSIQPASLPEEEKCINCHEYDCRCADYDRAQVS